MRHLERMATVAQNEVDAETPITRRVRIEDVWNRSRLRALVFLQDASTSAITGAAAAVIH